MKILIATDGSDFSRYAIEKVCEIMGMGGNNLIEIISVFEEVANPGIEPFAVSADYIREMEKSGHEQATKFADEAEKIIRGRVANSSAEVTTKIVKGSAGKEIVEEAENWGADLIVVGSHGYGFWERAWLGSTSDRIIHHAPCSVLVVKKKIDNKGAN
ncbi:MAG: universal stress protein, partial [Actinomycetota bacterium]